MAKSKSEATLDELLRSQSRALFYTHESMASSVPFEAPDGKTYNIERPDLIASQHDEDSEFDIDEQLVWRFEDENGNTFDLCDNDDGSLTLVSCTNAGAELIVPREVNGKTISAIAFFAFAQCEGLISLECPPCATKVHPNAFKNCSTIEKLVLPKQGSRMNRAWFKALKQLKSLVLPDNLTSISGKVFVSINLEYLFIGANTEDIEAGAFNFCAIRQLEISPENAWLTTDGQSIFKNNGASLLAYYGHDERYRIPEGCREIASNAFSYNKSLRRVDMPDTLETIGTYAFSNSMIEAFIAPKSLREIREKAFYFCAALSDVELNDALAFIGGDAFFKASIKELRIPASVEDIQLHAFYNTMATMQDPAESADAAPFAISVSHENPVLFIDPQGGLYKRTDEGLIFCEMLAAKIHGYDIAPGTIEIAEGAFIRHPYIEAVHLPEGLRHIGDSAFRGCKSLAQVNFPETLEGIGKEAFVETIIKEAYIPKGLTYLGELALRSSGKGFTHWLPGLKDLQIHPENEAFFIESGVLYQRKEGTVYAVQYIGPTEHVAIPHECTHIMPYAFAGISSISKLFLPSSIEHIGYSGFMFENAPEEIEIELKEPYKDHATVTAYFSRETISNQSVRKAFAPARLNIPDIFMYSDRAIIHTLNLYTRAKLAIQRLMDPVYTNPESIDLFQGIFRKDLARICREFAHNDFAKGFDYLIRLGFITKDNMTEIINNVSETNDVAMIGYLLELKHRNFGSSVSLDLDL